MKTRTRCTIATLLFFILSGPVVAQQSGDPASTLQLEMEGLERPVEIRVDAWGVSHIYAETERDLFFAQGYNAARDRLFQLEIWRRQATGTMAELLGERMVDHDIGARLMKFRGDMQREMTHYHDRGDVIIPAFTEGVNAYIREVRENPEMLPIEFQLLDFEPDYWTPEIVISRHQGLVGNVGQELNLARAVHTLGPEKVKELIWFHPGEPELTLDESIDGELLFENILHLYREARSQVRFEPEDLPSEYRAEVQPADTDPSRQDWFAEAATDVLGKDYDIGSNNWVVNSSLSESGYPMMANDPHRTLQAPALRYFVHLNGPGWNVAGGGEPSLPGISIGHNGFGAWGLTVFRLDSEDLYVYETHPDNPNLYRYQGGWEEMRTEQALIEVKDEEPREVTLKFTRHGPVIYEKEEANTAFALRLGWLEIGNAPYLSSLRMNQAQSWEEFREASTYNRLPGENMIWADRDGNIGLQSAGLTPLRPNWRGLLPVPGDGSHEWEGFLPIRELPNFANPARGYLHTANENLVGPTYPYIRHIGHTWTDPYRSDRIKEFLEQRRNFNLQDMASLQNDILSIPARTVTPLLKALTHPDDRVQSAMNRLLNWDYRMSGESVAAGIYMEWERQYRERVTDLYVPEEGRRWISQLQLKPTIDRLLSPDGRFGENPTEGRNRLLLDALEEAVAELTNRFGTNMNNWQYAKLDYKHVQMRHPMSGAVSDELRDDFEVGPLPRDGYSYNVKNTGYGDNQSSGGTFRILVDTEDFDRTLATNSPGQSGDPYSPYYDNLFEDWVNDRYFPLFYSRDKVESVTQEILRLEPAD